MFERARWTNSAKENTFKKQVILNKEFSHSTKNSDSNDILVLFVEVSNVTEAPKQLNRAFLNENV